MVSQRTGIVNQIRAFLLERGIAVRQGQRFLRAELPRILAAPSDVLSSRMVRVIEDLATHDGQEHNTLQSKAGYIDARPLTASSTKTLATRGRTIHRVKSEHGGCDL